MVIFRSIFLAYYLPVVYEAATIWDRKIDLIIIKRRISLRVLNREIIFSIGLKTDHYVHKRNAMFKTMQCSDVTLLEQLVRMQIKF